ncbi:MAG: hypothetical protein P8188_15095 [Gemmatimonadota bacterium]
MESLPDPSGHRRDRRLEILTVVVMGLSGVATAWSSYQAALWSGVQAEAYSSASGLRVESTRATATANTQRSVDVAVYMGWIEAYARDDERVMDFYRARFRDEFGPAFEAWIATRPGQNPDAPATPFAMEDYQLRQEALADSLVVEAEATFSEGREANRHSDRYVLALVLFATVLFLTGLTHTLGGGASAVSLLGLSLVLFAAAVYGLLALPRL